MNLSCRFECAELGEQLLLSYGVRTVCVVVRFTN